MAINNGVKQFADLLPDSVIVLSPSLQILWCNKQANKLFNVDVSRNCSLTELIVISEQKQFLNLDCYQAIDTCLVKNQNIHLSVSFIQKTKRQLVLLLQNVSHLHYLEKMRQDFVANVSHELRTPLTVMHGYLEILLESTLQDAKDYKIFTQMYQQSLRMEKLVEDLLLLSRLESHHQHENNQQTICISRLINSICDDARSLSGERSHCISLSVDKELQLLGDENEIHGAFSNLIFNAVHYTPAGGDITITWKKIADTAQLIVHDSGIGIATEDIPRITERFYRVDKARSRQSGGTGLGLAIVKHVLIRHEARLDVESTVGKGSMFRAIFPLTRIVSIS